MSKYWLKKIGLMLVTFSLAISCSMQGQDRTKNQLEELQGEILVWLEMSTESNPNLEDPHKIVFEDSLEEFKELYPRIKVFVKYFARGESIELFESQAKRGAGPDILLVYSNYPIVQLIKNKNLRAIDEFEINLSQFSDEIIKQVRYRDKIYGLPIYLSTQVLCYNKEHIKTTPKTLAELIEQARQGHSVGLVSGLGETFWGAGIFGGSLFDDSGRLAMNVNGGWARWMRWLKEAQNEPNFILSNKKEVLRRSFIQGKLAYLVCSTDVIPDFVEAMGKDRLGVTMLPTQGNQPATPLVNVGVSFFNRDSSPNQTQIALKLANFLSNREQQEQTQAAIPIIPSNKNVRFNQKLFPLRSTLHEQSKNAVSISLDERENLAVIVQEGNSVYKKVLEGEISPEEAVARLSQTFNRQLEEQKK
ncbi:MAG: extracellular solute-binding protein [Xenococcus sp. MO_188.B8]|nr:extracellular solute-binding protein [Xenococcus sp. MO_188.B8]